MFSRFFTLEKVVNVNFFRFWPKMTLIPARGVKRGLIGGVIGRFRESKNLRVFKKKIEIYNYCIKRKRQKAKTRCAILEAQSAKKRN